MVKWEKIDQNKVELEIEVGEPEVAEALTKAYKKIVRQVNLPGFRKGKVPRSVLETRFGPEVLYEEALETLVPDAYQSAVSESGIDPINQPQIDLVQMEKGKPLIFKAVVEVKPEVTLGEYRNVPVTVEGREITPEQVGEKLEQLRRQHVKLHVVEEGPVAQGDMVVLDFTGYLDGEPFEGGQAEGHSLEIGSGSFIPGFEEQLVGLAAGEEKEIQVTFPEDYHVESLAGKPASFRVNVREIKRKEFPELSDEFAAEVSEFATLQELKDDLENKLKKQEADRVKAEAENEVVEAVSANSEVYVPDVLVEREIDRMTGEMEHFLQMQGLSMDKFLQLTGKSKDEMRNDKREEAKKRVKGNLVLDAIIEKEGITALDEEVDERIRKFAEGYKQDFEKVKEYFVAQGQADVIRQEIKIRKAIDFLVAEASVTVTGKDSAPEVSED